MADRPRLERLLRAMRADVVEAPQESGLWHIRRQDLSADTAAHAFVRHEHHYDRWPGLPSVTTSLCRWTEATMNDPFGEAVMSDDPRELCRHLPAVLFARGRVLVSGLGLGCVVRGLLENPLVEHVDVVEIDWRVVDMVGPTLAGDPRVAIHHGDARTFAWPAGTRWDFVWHDVWSDQPDTQVVHASLLLKYRKRAGRQGAWMFPRMFKRRVRRSLRLVG